MPRPPAHRGAAVDVEAGHRRRRKSNQERVFSGKGRRQSVAGESNSSGQYTSRKYNEDTDTTDESGDEAEAIIARNKALGEGET